ncbi:MAG: hypothetical protein NVS9B8_02630 [Candidatus Limnocylindrales bacterium]
MVTCAALGHGGIEDATALRRCLRPGQTRREAGTQSQGSRGRDRPAAERTDAVGLKESQTMKTNLAIFKGQGFRLLLALSALASSALVLEAGQRWK